MSLNARLKCIIYVMVDRQKIANPCVHFPTAFLRKKYGKSRAGNFETKKEKGKISNAKLSDNYLL